MSKCTIIASIAFAKFIKGVKNMLKNELDEKVQQYRQKQYVSPEERTKQEKRHKAEVKEAANYAAKCIWEKISKKFIANCKKDEPVILFMGISEHPCNTEDNGNVYYKFCSDSQYRKLFSFKKIRYIKETMEAICKIADEEGISCISECYEPRMRRFLTYTTASWYRFTYYPPEQ